MVTVRIRSTFCVNEQAYRVENRTIHHMTSDEKIAYPRLEKNAWLK